MQTPKNVHWGHEPSFGSPMSEGSSAMPSTSSLDYINSQLVAHGFAPAPGLSLEGIPNADLERAVKCLLSMLSQRVDDMARTEDLTTKLRTLSYDHERLLAMYRTVTDTAANAERETNLHKSRLTAATRSLQASESAHKHTSAELQRVRTALQAVRATHQSELKKKEKEVERMQERWSKLADMQTKLSTASSGLRCANVKVVEGSEVLGKGPGLVELALEQAEQARQQLSAENVRLRGLLLGAVNEAQTMLYQTRKSEREEVPVPFTLLTLFPMAPQDAANEKLTSLLTALREAVRPSVSIVAPSPTTSPVPDGELARLQGVVETLKGEIERSQKQHMDHAIEAQAMFDQFAADPRVVDSDVGEASVELMIAPLRDAEKERLEKIKKQLDLERQNFTEAALKLGQEKAALEAERMKLLDEKRSWEVEQMLSELPATPNPPSPLGASTSRKLKSPRKSPAKGVAVGKAGANRKATRVSRRSSLVSPPRFQAAFETEVLPPLAAPLFTSAASSSLLPTSFVLPPPSPGSAFPAPDLLLSSSASRLLEVPHPPEVSQPSASASASTGPATPPNFRRPFPMAKPFAPRMIHAYSPAKPSPLSRILMLANSPATPTDDAGNVSMPLEALLEEDESAPALADALFPEVPPVRQPTLAEELGVSESPPESPEAPAPILVAEADRGRVFSREPTARFSAQEKGKGRAPEMGMGVGRGGKLAPVGEKENGEARPGIRRKMVGLPRVSPPLGGAADIGGKKAKPQGASGSAGGKSGSRARVMAKLPAPSASKTGPRRVLVDSAEASAGGRGWRG
ncbi:Afadin and alpha-actinin-binding-domain-containing protein [Mycena maculata]|uniref:Afadin and alpha-actinin-binding-domain-containing protein n=1 Tax=Mycena maculata TaxID=230809 RepID=A0AAD7NZX6_9AGAR|nr:Afadin and alpha-actinin-binding-domain-containing protein [Mycena maculata]